MLSRAGVPFTVKNVELDLSAYHELLDRGFRTVPVTLIGDVAIKGFDEAVLMRALGSAAPPSPDR